MATAGHWRLICLVLLALVLCSPADTAAVTDCPPAADTDESDYFGLTTGVSCLTSSTSDQFGPAGSTGCWTALRDFVRANYTSLQRDIAQGGGEFAAAYTRLVGCPAKAGRALAAGLRRRYGELYPAQVDAAVSAADVTRTINITERVISADPHLTCVPC